MQKYPGCNCDDCPFKEREFVPPYGPDNADILFLGQAPARVEVRLRKPFMGPAGSAFNSALEENGIDRDSGEKPTVKVDNAILCFFEGGERPPREALEACKGHLDLDSPKVVVPMGNDALGVVTGQWDGILKHSSRVTYKGDQAIMPLVHPAYYIRSAPNNFRDFKDGINLISRLASGKRYDHIGRNRIVVDTKQKALELFARIEEEKPRPLVVDLETDYPDIASAIITCVVISWEEDTSYIIPWSSEYLQKHESNLPALLEDWDVYNAFKKALESLPHGICAYNSMFDICLLLREDLNIQVDHDILMMHYALDERTGYQGLKMVSAFYLGVQDWESELKKYLPRKDSPYTEIPPDVLFEYAGMDGCTEVALFNLFSELLDQPENDGPSRLYYGEGIHPGLVGFVKLFVDVVQKGVSMDIQLIAQAMHELPEKLHSLLGELQDMAGDDTYNPNSYLDNRRILFGKLGLPKIKGDSTDADVLEALEDQHPFVHELIEFRQYQKVTNTYITNIARSYRSGKGHPDFRLFGTVTGRLSANKLNPLVFPRESRGDLYSIVKRIFVADADSFLLQADYSAMEYRVQAVLAQDPWMMEKLMDPDFDIHSTMAAEIFGDTFRNASPGLKKELRVIAKMLVFGLNYGRGPLSIGLQLGCTLSVKQREALGTYDGTGGCPKCDKNLKCERAYQEAKAMVEAYFKPIPMISQWRERMTWEAFNLGYLENPFGRRRRFDLITEQNQGNIRTQALNSPVQGTANDCNLTTMYRIWHEMGDLARPLWPIHDSIMVNVSSKATTKDVDAILEIMQETPRLMLETEVPFYIDADIGYRWGELTKYKGVIPERSEADKVFA